VITGSAYGRRATLEVNGNTLVWRATKGGLAPVPENIVTTVHEVRSARYVALRWSYAGLGLAALAGIWAAALDSPLVGAIGALAGAGLVGWRLTHPRYFLVLDIGDRRLVLRLALESISEARSIAGRIQNALASGEEPSSPPMLP
jgi:hypothetical protein